LVVLYGGGGGGDFLTIGGTGGGSHLRSPNLKPSLFFQSYFVKSNNPLASLSDSAIIKLVISFHLPQLILYFFITKININQSAKWKWVINDIFTTTYYLKKKKRGDECLTLNRLL